MQQVALGKLMILVAAGAAQGIAIAQSPPPSDGQTKSFKTLPHCIAAYEYQRKLGMDANAIASKAKFNTIEEGDALKEQNLRFKQANEIKAVCDKMEKDQRPIADQVRELSRELDGLGPVSGSMRTPVAGAIREHNLKAVGTKMEGVTGTLDQALQDFQAANFNGRSGSSSTSASPALGVGAATSLRQDVSAWQREEAAREAERQRLAAIEAAQRAEQERLAYAERQAAAEARASSGSGFLNILGGLAVGFSAAAAMKSNRSVPTAVAPTNSGNLGSLPLPQQPTTYPPSKSCYYDYATGARCKAK